MDAKSIAAVSAAVVTLTQFSKWSGVPDKAGPLMVLFLSALGVGLWGWSNNDYNRAATFDYFAGWIVVATSAAGVWGFSRAGGEALTRAKAPPSGAMDSPTIKNE